MNHHAPMQTTSTLKDYQLLFSRESVDQYLQYREFRHKLEAKLHRMRLEEEWRKTKKSEPAMEQSQ